MSATPFPLDFNAFNNQGNWEDLQHVLSIMVAEKEASDIDFNEIGYLALQREASLITEFHFQKEFFLCVIDAVNEWIESHPHYKSEAA